MFSTLLPSCPNRFCLGSWLIIIRIDSDSFLKSKMMVYAFISPQNSAQHWLYPVGGHLQKIIEEKKSEIKNCLSPLVDEYPDFR